MARTRSGFPYRVAVEWSEEDSAYIGRVPALPYCAAHGDTAADAAREAVDGALGILESLAASGGTTPPGDLDRGHSGNIRLRLPRFLHEQLARRAVLEGVSLNQLMVALLAARSAAEVALPWADRVAEAPAVRPGRSASRRRATPASRT